MLWGWLGNRSVNVCGHASAGQVCTRISEGRRDDYMIENDLKSETSQQKKKKRRRRSSWSQGRWSLFFCFPLFISFIEK